MLHNDYLEKTVTQLLKAIVHLKYSYQKVLLLPVELNQLDEETLATWESFSIRFSRVTDLFLMRYLKAVVKHHDPAFDGTVRDLLNQAEKLNLIDNAADWLIIRGLRNIMTEYTDNNLSIYLTQLKTECPKLIAIESIIHAS